MAETPEEVALRRALMALRLEVDGSIVDDFTKYADAALRAQYVAGVRDALREINAESRLWDGDCAEPFPSLRKRIRELAEQAKAGK